jgi:hypothetical protein
MHTHEAGINHDTNKPDNRLRDAATLRVTFSMCSTVTTQLATMACCDLPFRVLVSLYLMQHSRVLNQIYLLPEVGMLTGF